MKHFLVKLSLQEKAESARNRIVKVLMTAYGYTDAEATAIKIYTDKFKEEYKNPSVVTIGPESYNLEFDFLAPDSVEEDAEYSRVYRLKLATTFKGDEAKRVVKTVLCRATDIDEALKKSQKEVKKFYDAQAVEVIKVEETDIYPESPIFDPKVEEVVTEDSPEEAPVVKGKGKTK